MNLKEFISETLTEIQAGVQDAIQKTKETQTNGAINPVWGGSEDISSEYIQSVKFDIAVTISDKVTGGAEGGIKVVGMKVGANKEESSETSHISRIQFSIPIIPPVTSVN